MAELLKPLADKKAPERARLAALTAMAQVAQQSEGAMIFIRKLHQLLRTPDAQLAPNRNFQNLGRQLCGQGKLGRGIVYREALHI